MRQIKFRAWDTVENEWVKEVFFVGSTGIVVDVAGRELTLVAEPDRLIIEQYIGLYDDDGAEIFAGDIITIRHHDDEEDDALQTTVTAHGDCDWPDIPDTEGDSGQLRYIWTEVAAKVIGNVHENPELLTQSGEKHAP